MTVRLLALGVVALAGTLPQRAWTDPSKHAATLVLVDANVELEVLDWGGSGPPIVLLAGLGDTGHVYDDFATSLTARHRVVAVTRRAHGRSSAAATGYDFPRLAEDILRVIEALRLDRPMVIGHSFAGEEMHELGARYADRIARLVYLDAAFDRGNNADNQAYDEARYLTNPDGTVGGMWAPATPIRQEMARQMQAAYRAYKPAPIQVPALAIYAAPKDRN